jgi:hypothetical protein
MRYVWGRGEGDLKERDNLETLSVDGIIILQ